MINKSDFHFIPDIITSVANNIPISTESAMIEEYAFDNSIKQNVFNVLNIYGIMFLTSNGNTQKYSNQTT